MLGLYGALLYAAAQLLQEFVQPDGLLRELAIGVRKRPPVAVAER